MGGGSSKKGREVSVNDELSQNNNNSAVNNTDNNDNNKVLDLSKLDLQYIETIRKDFRETPELFLLNNVLMCVMFFTDYKKFSEEQIKHKLVKQIDCLAPDIIFEEVNKNITYRPHHGTKKHQSEPLIPKRLYVLNDEVKVLGTIEDATNIEDEDKTVVRIEESRKRGYIRLKEIVERPTYSGSPVLTLDDNSEPNSRSSNDSSDTAYTNFTDLRTPTPMDILNGLKRQSSKSVALPKTCISYRKIKKISWDSDELRGEKISEDDLYDTVSYINSKSFRKYSQNDTLLSTAALYLDIQEEDIQETQIIQEKVVFDTITSEKKIPYEIIPSIKAKWPLEQTLEFATKGERSSEGKKVCIFPTSSMVEEIITLDCVLLPKGYSYKRGEYNDSDIEWELCFPQAQRYLESFMSHAQMKSLIILLTLHKTFIEPQTAHLGLTADHIRNFIFLECESHYSDWAEHRLGIKLLKVLKRLHTHLSQAKPCIPDFFVTNKNTLSEVPIRKIRRALMALDEILQSPLMYFIKALRNLRYTDGRNFFPPLNFKQLHDLLNKSGLEFSNPQLASRLRKKPRFTDTEAMVSHLRDAKKRQKILRQRQEEEEREKNDKDDQPRKGSVDSINMEWICEKQFNLQKKRALLKFFIDTFIEIAEKCLTISSKKNTLFYIKQAYYLSTILREECAAFAGDAYEYNEKIFELEAKCNLLEKEQTVDEIKVEFVKNPKKLNANVKHDKENSVDNGSVPPRKSVTFVEVHSST
ncbi:uncharacterized protein LOC114336165 [Diabrotica virgifera virgifera]|uniref:Uncharacterized protein LOC114336165 n=1 Tax=Diabrotica virgifera virgifera TaxID=50390 RepID=A0A6P7GDR6_DIAVI|nr:uncharacterized protein LOC114336165 [Diabrotica virgifera virgifera]